MVGARGFVPMTPSGEAASGQMPEFIAQAANVTK